MTMVVQFLEAHIFPKRPTSRIAVVSKLLVDQLLFAPVSTILLFAALEAMKGTPELISVVISVRTNPMHAWETCCRPGSCPVLH